MKIKAGLLNSIICVFAIILIIPGVFPGVAFALEGQTDTTPHANLTIENFYVDNAAPRPNSTVAITAVVKNTGDLVSNPVYLVLTIDGVSTQNYLEPIWPGSEATFSQTWTTPAQEGTVILKASIDGMVNSEKEIDLSIQNPRPDLIIQDIVPDPVAPQEGQPLNLIVQVKNQGSAPSGEALAMYYINDIAGGTLSIPPLAEGASNSTSFSLSSDQVKGGDMKVKIVADSGNTVLESNETNNELTKTIKVKGLPLDLTIESITLNPGIPNVGANVTFTVTIKNSGLGASQTCKLKHYINGTSEANSGILSSNTLPVPALNSGGTAQVSFSWAPANIGNIAVTALVDSDAVITEMDETNNQLTTTAIVVQESTSADGGGGGSSSSSSSGSSSGSKKSKSSSSGIGNSFTKEPAQNIAAKELATRNVLSGNRIRFDFLQNNTCILYIEYDAEKTFQRTTTAVEELKNKSVFVPVSPSGRIYKYANIWVGEKGGGLSTSLKNGVIGFKVERAWINNNKVNESLIVLQQFNKSWEPLNTEKFGEDNNYAYFKADTSSFSFFAITENVTQIDSKLPNIGKKVKDKSENKTNAQAMKDISKKLMAIILPLFLVFIGYLIFKKKI